MSEVMIKFLDCITNNKIKNLSFIIIMIFAFLGLTFVSNIIHEKSHEYDFKDLANEGSICLLVMPENITDLFSKKIFSQPIATYDFSYNLSNESQVDAIMKTTERKAYGIEIAILILFGLFSIVTVLHWFINTKNLNKNSKSKSLYKSRTLKRYGK